MTMPRWCLLLGLLVVSGCGVPTAPSSEVTLVTEAPVEPSTQVPSTAAAEASSVALAPSSVVTETSLLGLDVQPPPLGLCVDARSQLAPPVPSGWQRFVLQAQATGSCGVYPFLMMSLVMPGTLVTIVTSPASEATPQPGAPVVIDGRTGTLQESTSADGQPASSINIVIDTVAVNAHGNVDAAQLQAIVASIRPLDDTEWADLVASIAKAP